MRLVALPVVALIALAAIGTSPVVADEASPKSGAMSHGWGFSEQGGADLFRNVCAGCHQPDARGAIGAGAYPPLASDKNVASSDLVLAVLFGGLRDMPPIGDMMSDTQVADVVNYVRTHFGNDYADAVSAAAVAAARRRASAP